MELRQLHYFRVVAEVLNFSRAAERLHVGQPAISRQIQSLESGLGVCLLDRNRQRVRLTDAGRVLLAHAEKVLAEIDMAKTAVRSVSAGRGGELIIGSNWRLSFALLQDSVAEFRRRLPEAQVSFQNVPMHEQVAALLSRKIHLAFLPGELVNPNEQLERFPVLSSELVVIVPTTHRFAKRRRVPLAELANETWLQPGGMNNGFRLFLSQNCRQAGFTPIYGKSEVSVEGLLSIAAAGYGICFLPRLAVPRLSRSLRCLHTDCAPLNLCAVWRRGNQSHLLEQYLAILRSHIRK